MFVPSTFVFGRHYIVVFCGRILGVFYGKDGLLLGAVVGLPSS